MALGAGEWETLRAAMDRIVPADEQPSATEAGVEGYFRKQFEGDLRHVAVRYETCLKALDAEAQARHGACFKELDPGRQDSLLLLVEQGDVKAVWGQAPAEFFRMLVEHVSEGYWADPSNGGNRGGVSWEALGFRSWSSGGGRPAGRPYGSAQEGT